SGMDELLGTESKKYEISLSSTMSRDELARHGVFNSIEMAGDNSFLAESALSANKLTEYIVKQQWGLTRFTRHEVSLEQIFIDLTTGETKTSSPSKSI
ncbi:MAG: hypothetical protein IMF15_03735, partial [Proteobacteria bacterium]|nr:hypothetical protein [Pseudomonadota bacterium]